MNNLSAQKELDKTFHYVVIQTTATDLQSVFQTPLPLVRVALTLLQQWIKSTKSGLVTFKACNEIVCGAVGSPHLHLPG